MPRVAKWTLLLTCGLATLSLVGYGTSVAVSRGESTTIQQPSLGDHAPIRVSSAKQGKGTHHAMLAARPVALQSDSRAHPSDELLEGMRSYRPVLKAPYFSQTVFQINGGWYEAPLTKGERVSAVALSDGIAWTIQTAVSSGQAASISHARIYLSPYRQGTTKARPSLLQEGTQLYKTTTSPGTSDIITLYQWNQGLLYTMTRSIGSGREQERLYFATPDAQPTLLTTVNGLSLTGSLQAVDTGILYAFGQHTDGAVRLKAVGFFNPQTHIATSLPATVWPVAIDSVAGDSVNVLSGPSAIAVTLDTGKVTVSPAPADPSLREQALKSLHTKSWTVLYLPNAAPDLAHSAYTWSHGSDHTYTIDVGNPLSRQDVSVTVQSLPVHGAIHSPDQTPTTILKPSRFFGNYQVKHAFTLSSKEGPLVTWAYTKNEERKVAWFASFTSAGWRFMIGPFSSPANLAQIRQLRSLLALYAHGPVLPLGAAGQVNMRMQSDTNKQSQVLFSPAPGLEVSAEGPSLSPLSVLSQWTVNPVNGG
ncbi:MAG: hypothetical protein OWT28_10610 [Firmicutes bacterium]|nr:hypothetical protein [Bacillota bacterium]